MQKYKKRELLNAVATLEKVNRTLGSKGANLSTAAEVLSQCQETAILIGSYLETKGEAGQRIVKELEDYCENLYQMSILLGDENQRRNISKKIQKQLIQITNEIRNQLTDEKRKIVFFPYKASMWDSMESIWQESVKDERVQTYVVPLPYYDRNPDGTMGEMHYEGLELPGEVIVTDWKSYHLDEEQLDVAYIHNPYDSWNTVTCIHPVFFTENLKKYVDTVVYVPYFSTMNYVEKHFCTLPGVLYSDAVVVQTEKIKQMYIEALFEFEKENGLNGVFSENQDKFYVFGSPKFDKIMNMDKFCYEIPEAWRTLIVREDGSKRRVILFNTSVKGLLLYREAQIEKIKQVIALFAQRDDVILLWRPHPLNESTIKSMLPHLLQEYLELEKNFKEEKKGIFDDTADLHRAIAISDAYYGAGGSLLSLYGLTGKPILKGDFHLQESGDYRKNRCITLADTYVDDSGNLWFCAVEFNGLFQYNIAEDELIWKGSFPNESQRRYRYSRCIAYKEKLFFPPYAAEEMAVYDMVTEKFQKIPINTYGAIGQKIYALAQYNGKLFCFGARMPAVLCLDLETYEITYFEEAHRELSKYFINEDYPILNRDVIVNDNICLLSSGRANIVLEFHMDDLSYRIHRIGNMDNCYISMIQFRNKIYLLPRNAANVVCWDYHSGRVYEVDTPERESPEENAYFNFCEYDDELWLFAFKGQYNGKIPKGKEVIEIVEDMNDFEKDDFFCEDAKKYGEQKISWAHSDGTNLYYFSTMNKTLYIKNGKSGQVVKRHLMMHKEDYRRARIPYLFGDRESSKTAVQCIYKENEIRTLEDYVDFIAANANLKSERQIKLFLSENAEGHADCGRLCHEQFNLEE